MIDDIFINASKKKMKPRRKYEKKDQGRLVVTCNNANLDFSSLTFSQDSIDGSLRMARRLVMYWRLLLPNAEIHIRRGHKVIIKTHNSADGYKAYKFGLLVNRN